MNQREHTPLLPHEAFFGLFLAVTWLRLGIAAGFASGDTMLYFALIAVNIGLWLWCRSNETPVRWRLLLLFYPIAMNILFEHLKVVVPQIHPAAADALLWQADTFLIGRNLSLRLQPIVNPVLTELFSASYFLFFFPYLLYCLVSYFRGDLRLLKGFMAGMFTIYGIGMLGYTWFPARGPYVFMAHEFSVPLTGWWMTRLNAWVVPLGTNNADVFPSLHCALSSYMLLYDRWYHRRRFWFYLLPCIALCLATVYLRYHYVTDIIAGFGLSALALWFARRVAEGSSGAAERQSAGAAEAEAAVCSRVSRVAHGASGLRPALETSAKGKT